FRAIVRSMRHLYLHVPFCRRRCTYCDFSIAVRKRIPAREYVDAVLQEVNIPGVTDPGREPGDSGSEVLETIYLGGGTPSLLAPDWGRDLEQALALRPAHLSLYGLTVEERTPLARWISRGATSPPDDERYAAEYLLAHSRLAACGYHFYEVSNAALDGCRSRHNSAYWSGRSYSGLGPAAHSFDGAARRWNLSAWESYRRAVAAGRSPVASQEILSNEQRELERVYLALRTDAGLDVAALYRPLPSSTVRWLERGWAEVRNQRLVCTPEGWLRLDALVRDLTGCGTTG